MRLFLSSYRLGNHAEEFVKLLGKNRKVAVIGNGADYKTQSERKQKMDEEIAELRAIGCKPEELDLRNYFSKPKNELEKVLIKFGAVWVRGGNVFILRRAMKESKFDRIVVELLENNEIVYGGYSAAACVLAPTLKGYSIVDDPRIIPREYNAQTIWDGLDILDYSIEPHYKSDHPESADVDKEIDYLKERNMPYKTLRDGEVLLINGKETIHLK